MTYFVELDLPDQPLVENFERPANVAVIGAPTYISISLDFVKKETVCVKDFMGKAEVCKKKKSEITNLGSEILKNKKETIININILPFFY